MKTKRIAVVLLVSLLVFMQSIGLTAFADTPTSSMSKAWISARPTPKTSS